MIVIKIIINMAEGNNYKEMHPFSCASFAINVDTIGNTASLMIVEKSSPSSNDVEAVTDFIRFGAEITKIVFTDIAKLIKESANALPMVHLCEIIEDCHSVAKIHIRSRKTLLLQHYHILYIL